MKKRQDVYTWHAVTQYLTYTVTKKMSPSYIKLDQINKYNESLSSRRRSYIQLCSNYSSVGFQSLLYLEQVIMQDNQEHSYVYQRLMEFSNHDKQLSEKSTR